MDEWMNEWMNTWMNEWMNGLFQPREIYADIGWNKPTTDVIRKNFYTAFNVKDLFHNIQSS